MSDLITMDRKRIAEAMGSLHFIREAVIEGDGEHKNASNDQVYNFILRHVDMAIESLSK